MESLERRELLSAFVSTAGVGNWSALSTWATQDGGAVTHVPGAGDTVTINGKVTVDMATTIGTGSGDVIVLNTSANVGDKKLTIAAPLTVTGSIKFLGKSVIDVQAGAGLEFDATSGVQPRVHAPDNCVMNLYFHGTASNHSYLRTKVGTAGLPVVVTSDVSWQPCNVAATYTDFTDVNGGPNANGTWFQGGWGLAVIPDSTALMPGIDHCVFTRSTLYANGRSTDFTLSNSYFDQGPLAAYGDIKTEAFFVGSGGHVSLVSDGFDHCVWLETMKTITGNVFGDGTYFNPYAGTGFQTWSNNIYETTDPNGGYFHPMAGLYTRMYTICTVPDVSNPHIMGDAPSNVTFDQSIWDVPTADYVDDAFMQLAGARNNVIQRCLSLPRMGGNYAGSGTSLGFADGVNIAYDHNVMAIGAGCGVFCDSAHGGATGGIAEFKSNIGFTLDGAVTGGSMINELRWNSPAYNDPVLPANCDYNAKYKCDYNMPTSSTPGVHDVNGQNPNFIDPSRNLIRWYRMQPGVVAGTVDHDSQAAVDWMRTHPGNVSAMIDWIYTGFIPTNIAYKAAADNVAPTNGWIGAMEGKPVGDANLDGKTNFQDYVILERNFGQANMGWEGGDFNNDGVVNFQDYIILERNFGTSYVSSAPASAPAVASPDQLANSITPTGGTDLPASTPVVGPVAPLYMLNGTTTAASTPSTLFSTVGPVTLPTTGSTGPALRSVTWPKAQKWQLPAVKGAMDSMMVDVLGAALE